MAGLAQASERTPILVVTPTLVDAERTAEDIACFLGRPPVEAAVGEPAGPVALFAPWETLPFERVSPEVATMGHRLALLWHLFGAAEDGAEAASGSWWRRSERSSSVSDRGPRRPGRSS